MPLTCTVLIAAADILPALRPRAAPDAGELLTFADTDALRALQTITSRRPDVVALERGFAASARGSAMIKRIRADPSLLKTTVRIVSHDTEQAKASAAAFSPAAAAAVTVASTPPPTLPAAALDHAGTRLSPRVRIAQGVDVLVDGNAAGLVDLSTGGAQVLSPTVLKPNQRVRITFTDDQSTWRLAGMVAWATFEIPPRYRAGIAFADGDVRMIEAFAERHRRQDD